MKRSQSVSRVADEDLARKFPMTYQPILEKKIQSLYRHANSISNSKFLIIPLVDKLNLIHAHRGKSFEKVPKVSPPLRLLRRNDSSSVSCLSNPSTGRILRTAKENSLNRQEKSKELLIQAEKIVRIEKENNEEIKKASNCYHRLIRDNVKRINKRLSIEGLPGIELSKKILHKRSSKNQLKKLEPPSFTPYPVFHRGNLSIKN